MSKIDQHTLPYLAPAHLNHIRANIDWQAMFDGLSLKKSVKKSKPNDWWAFSPFHKEKTPSFHMGAGGIWHDFSIGEGGGAIELVQKLRHCNCYEAGRFILDQGWVTSPLLNTPAKHCKDIQNRVSESMAKENASTVLTNPSIRQDLIPMTSYHPYLEARGVSETTCQELGIGFLAQGRSPLRGRVVFQIRDARVKGKGKNKQCQPVILSHLGRSIEASQPPKYLFYEGFHKSAELYGQDIIWLDDEASQQIKNTGKIILTEGTLDLAKAYEAGLRNVVASFGAGLSEEQAIKLEAMTAHHNIDTIQIIYDRDEAGIAGANKAAELLKEYNLQVNIFDWEKPVTQSQDNTVRIPPTISDLADFNTEQIIWLRKKALL